MKKMKKILATVFAVTMMVSAIGTIAPTAVDAAITNPLPMEGQESWTSNLYCANPYDTITAEQLLQVTKVEIDINATVATGTWASTVSGNVYFMDSWSEDSVKILFGPDGMDSYDDLPIVPCFGMGETTISLSLEDNSPIFNHGTGDVSIMIAAEGKSEFSVEALRYYNAEGKRLTVNGEVDDTAEPGDVNEDGKISVADAVSLTKMLVNKAPITISGDVNRDGAINVFDLMKIKSIIINNAAGTPDGFRNITSMELVKDMGAGWNLGNSFESFYSGSASTDETGWGNPVVTKELIQKVHAEGFDTIRIPVTWMEHMDTEGNIDEAWLTRVQQIVDYAINEGMYVVLNIHNDGGGDTESWFRKASTDYEGTMAIYDNLWTQIADRFGNYSDYLIFENLNEVEFPDLSKPEGYALLNKINAHFVDLIRNSGKKNASRHLLLAGYNTDIDQSVAGITMPKDDRVILSVHYYTPYAFCLAGTQTSWGTDADIAEMKSYLNKLKTKFINNGVPVIIGEYGVTDEATADNASEIFYNEMFIKTCVDMNISPILWDKGDEFSRSTYTWSVNGLGDAIRRAISDEDYTPTKN